MRNPLTVVILAAGLGTRMKIAQGQSAARAGGKTLVEHVVDTALALDPAGAHLRRWWDTRRKRCGKLSTTPGSRLHRADGAEGHRPRGDGRAARRWRGLDGYLMILYGDCPLLRAETLRRLIDQATAGSGRRRPDERDDGRSHRLRPGDPRFARATSARWWSRRPARRSNSPSAKPTWGSTVSARTFWKHVDEIRPNNPAREYYLTDMAAILNARGPPRGGDADRRRAAKRSGINNRVELAEVDRIFRERKARELMLAGVTIEKPETVTIDAGVEIGMDTVVEPFAQILRQDDDRRELPDRRLRPSLQDSELADEVEIGAVHHRRHVAAGARRARRAVRAAAHGEPCREPARTSATSWS